MRREAWDLLRAGRPAEAEALARDGVRSAAGTRALTGWMLILLELACSRPDQDFMQAMGRLTEALGVALNRPDFLREAADICHPRQADWASRFVQSAVSLETP